MLGGADELTVASFALFQYLLLGIAIALVAGRLSTKPMPRPNACNHCRYDVSGLDGGTVCPECGTPLGKDRSTPG
jgi:hypothetical protein